MDMDTEEVKKTLKQYKQPIVTGLVAVGFASMIFSIRRKTRGTRDFGYQKIMNTPGIQGNGRYASYIWAFRAFMLSTSIVGLGSIGIGFGVSHYFGVSSLKEFSQVFPVWVKQTFPALVVENPDTDDKALDDFMKEWNSESEKEEYKESAFSTVVGESVRKVFRP
jgi:hypothetical protein